MQQRNAQEDQPQYHLETGWPHELELVQLKQVLRVLECLLNLKPVVVNLHNLVPGASHVIGKDIPRLRSATALWRTDDAKRHPKELYCCIFFLEPLYPCFLTVTLDVVPTLEPNVK